MTKPVKWETTVRAYDKDDKLVSETTTVQTVTEPPAPPPQPQTGFYL